jgi:PHD/YefM family antitoxin component YafN of YafNO toxin-antitoxin module
LQLPLRARYVIGCPHGVSGRFAPASEGRVEIASRSFVVDENGKRTAVVLPIEEYERLLEDLEDLALIAQRRNEPTESLATVAERLERKWQGEQSR